MQNKIENIVDGDTLTSECVDNKIGTAFTDSIDNKAYDFDSFVFVKQVLGKEKWHDFLND